MTLPAVGSVWFEVATDDPDTAEKFYSAVFDWTFVTDGGALAAGMDYRVVTPVPGSAPTGGIMGTGGAMPGHAVFSIAVTDVAAVCAAVGRNGGSVVVQHEASERGPALAYLRDPAGNLFGVFAPASAG